MSSGIVGREASVGSHRNILICLCVALVVATAVVYLPVRHHEFVNLDDNMFVTENPHLRGGFTWQSVRWAFTAGWIHDDRNADYWRPVSYLSHALDIELFGLRPAGHHLMNVAIHAAAAVALFLVLQSMTNAPWRCAFVAALFALHPLRVESVAWVAERKDVLSALLFMLTLGAYIRYVRGPFSMSRYLAVLFVFGLALMAKPMVATLPFVLLLLDYWPLGRTRWAKPETGENVTATPSQLLKEKVPLFALAAVSSIVTSLGQRKAMGLSSVPLGIRTTNAVVSYVSYIGKTFWPIKLAVYYPLRADLPAVTVVGAGVGLAAVTTAVVCGARRMPWLVTGWFWYLGMLVPVIGLVQGAGESMADRFAYLPLVGLFMMVCWSVPYRETERPIFKVITCVAAVAVLAACAALSRIQVRYWKDSETLFRHALDVTRDNWLAHFNLGIALEQAGKVPEAIGHYEQALQIRPDYAKVHNDLGTLLGREGRTREAIAHLEEALRLMPEFAEAHVNLGNALLDQGALDPARRQFEEAVRLRPDLTEAYNGLGNVLLRLDKVQEAIGQYELALRLNPDLAFLYGNLGNALVRAGRIEDAIGQYEHALRLNPDLVATRLSLGNILLDAGRFQDAIAQYQELLRTRPEHAEAHYDLGNALAKAGKAQGAVRQYEDALRIRPDYAAAHNNLAVVLAKAGRLEDAIPHFEQVTRLSPDDADAHYNLGNALVLAGKTNDAIGQYEQVLRLKPNDANAQSNLARVRAAQ